MYFEDSKLLSFTNNIDYEGSEFEFDTNKQNISKKTKKIFPISTSSTLPSKNQLKEEHSKTIGQINSFHYRSMDAYSKHKKLVNDYMMYYSNGKSLKDVFKRDT